MKKTIAIVTPVYNRRVKMKRLYKSLMNQKNKDFYWIIVDDGSKDELEKDIEEYRKLADFEIEYYYQKNAGKHAALNKAFDVLDSELMMIVDSDDYLVEEATDIILEDWEKLSEDANICSLIYLKGYNEKDVIGDKFKKDRVIANEIDVRERHFVAGDKAEVFVSKYVKEYRFPVFADEKFQGENYVWWQLSFEHDSFYVNRIIYIAEYLEGGLSKSGRVLRVKCPKGGMENSRIGMDKRFPMKKRIKRALLYVCYGLFAKRSFNEIIKSSGYTGLVTVAYIPGFLLYLYWKRLVN